ncbi:FAD-dependent oxidoreductase [Bradyrhizobium sp. STM 3562]|uniref:FAD-dependent oxidoreductase n=1 Tax=Bradyrhizobium sp. STM 3562 TaxID=578924 RepID=UPI003890C422
MIGDRFDAIVVGAGMAGNAAALSMAKRGMKVLQLERGEYSGSKNTQNAILNPEILQELIPDFRADAPLERRLVEQRFWMMDERSHVGLRYRFNHCNGKRPNRYLILRARFDRWFSAKVREAGATVLCQTSVIELAQNRAGRVIGVRTDRQRDIIQADVVVIAEGVNKLLATRAGFCARPKPHEVALLVKQVHSLPRRIIEARLNLKRDEGLMIETAGTISHGMSGMGFIYVNKDSISLGIACLVSDLQRGGERPYGILERFKRHPSVLSLIEGSEPNDYSAHLIPEGAYNSKPRLFGEGWVLVGDAVQLNNFVRHEDSSLAIASGRIAAEAIFRVKSSGDPITPDCLSLYETMLNHFVAHSKKPFPALLHTRPENFRLTHAQLIAKAMDNFAQLGGISDPQQERRTSASFLNSCGWGWSVRDTFRRRLLR